MVAILMLTRSLRYTVLVCVLFAIFGLSYLYFFPHKDQTKQLAEQINTAPKSIRINAKGPDTHLAAVFPHAEIKQSQLFLPITIPIELVRQKLENDTDIRFEGEEKNTAGKLLKEEKLTWWLERDEFAVQKHDEDLHLSVQTKGLARLRGKTGIGTKVSTHLDLLATLHVWLDPKLQEDWTLEPNFKGEADVDEAILEILNKKINVKGKIRKQLNRSIHKALHKETQKLGAPGKLKESIAKQWVKLHQVKPISRSPQAWSQTKPTSIQVTQFDITDNGIEFGIGFNIETNILVQDQEPELIITDLPDANIHTFTPANLTLNLSVASELSVLASQIKNKVVGELETRDLPEFSATLNDLNLLSDGENLLLAVDITGKHEETTIEAKIYLKAKPELDTENKEIRLTEIDYWLDSKSILANELAALPKEQLLEKVRSQAKIDLTEHYEDALSQANEEFKKILQDLPPDSTLAGEVKDVSLSQIALSSGHLLIGVRAETLLEGKVILDKL